MQLDMDYQMAVQQAEQGPDATDPWAETADPEVTQQDPTGFEGMDFEAEDMSKMWSSDGETKTAGILDIVGDKVSSGVAQALHSLESLIVKILGKTREKATVIRALDEVGSGAGAPSTAPKRTVFVRRSAPRRIPRLTSEPG